MLLEPGTLVEGKYRVTRQIGAGGMGAVYEAEAIRIHRRVAIKVLFKHLGDDAARRFYMEAQAGGRIGSQHIVDVLDVGVLESGSHYMVMEYLEGDSLRARISERGRLTSEEAVPIAVQLLTALAAAHGKGVVHRDLKPDNVFLVRTEDARDHVKLLDFGISKFDSRTSGGQAEAMSLTRTGAVLGTPYYMSPEQARGDRDINHRSDLYSVGVILYECLTGVVPFAADSFNQLVFKIALERPQPIPELVPDVDPEIAALVDKAMSREPAQRFQTALEMRTAFDAWLQGHRGPRMQTDSVASGRRGDPPTQHIDPSTPGIWARSGAEELPDPAPPRRRRFVLPAVVLLLGVVVAAAAASLLSGRGEVATESPSAAPASPSSAAAVSPLPEPSMGAQAKHDSAPSGTAPEVAPEATLRAPTAAAAPARRAPSRKAAPAASVLSKPAVRPDPATAPKSDDVSRTRSGRVIRSDL